MLQQAIFATAYHRFLYAIFTPFPRGKCKRDSQKGQKAGNFRRTL